jgi:hypothetical protein
MGRLLFQRLSNLPEHVKYLVDHGHSRTFLVWGSQFSVEQGWLLIGNSLLGAMQAE